MEIKQILVRNPNLITTKHWHSKISNLSQTQWSIEFSDIDGTMLHKLPENQDLFTLFDFSAKWDIVPTLLCQNHTRIIKGFMGQTTDFKSSLIKSNVLVMGESKVFGTARYIHGEYVKRAMDFLWWSRPRRLQTLCK